MDRTTAAPYEQQLRTQQAALLTQIAAQRGGTIGRAEAAAEHFAGAQESQAQMLTARDLEFAIDEHETAHLTQIDAALQRIAAGTYGECVDCGADIAPARLQATPEAARCLGCQEAAERPHLQHA
ncbi:TraR/DksA family transcriptional regulator [Acidovorax lacteus]|uniref:Zinc finger DksA/TraR C4-type domain-containing protein n=1 Tax=Acidovorax lacteus TaxID=1924988 RepID=A0ABP8KWS0_9BURK